MFTGVYLSTRGVPGPGGGAFGGCLLPWVAWSEGSGPRSALSGGGAWWRPPPMATAAGGTHPTGMHSCTHGCIDLVLTRVLTLYLQGYRINAHRGTGLVLTLCLQRY